MPEFFTRPLVNDRMRCKKTPEKAGKANLLCLIHIRSIAPHLLYAPESASLYLLARISLLTSKTATKRDRWCSPGVSGRGLCPAKKMKIGGGISMNNVDRDKQGAETCTFLFCPIIWTYPLLACSSQPDPSLPGAPLCIGASHIGGTLPDGEGE